MTTTRRRSAALLSTPGEAGDPPAQFLDVAVDTQGNVFGGEVGLIQGITKFIPRLKR